MHLLLLILMQVKKKFNLEELSKNSKSRKSTLKKCLSMKTNLKTISKHRGLLTFQQESQKKICRNLQEKTNQQKIQMKNVLAISTQWKEELTLNLISRRHMIIRLIKINWQRIKEDKLSLICKELSVWILGLRKCKTKKS